MAKKAIAQETKTFPRHPDQGEGPGTKPPEVVGLLARVDRFFRAGQPANALDAVRRFPVPSPWVTNALGVCQFRLGNARAAVDVFRGLVLSGGVALRADVPPVFRTNFAAALLAADNLAGCLRVLHELRDEQNPAVRRLREAIRRWQNGLTWWQKINWYLGGQPDHPLGLDFPLGDLE
jgi:hypothetical protein